MDVGIRAFYSENVKAGIPFTVFKRFVVQLSDTEREALGAYSAEGEDCSHEGVKAGEVVRHIHMRWIVAQRNILKGCGPYAWLARPGIGGYRIREFPTVSGAEFAKAWNTLHRNERVAILNTSRGIPFAETAKTLSVATQSVRRIYRDAERALHVATNPDSLEYHLHARTARALARCGITTRDGLCAYLRNGGLLEHIPSIGERGVWDVFEYLGGPVVNTAGEIEYVPLSVQNSLADAGIITVKDLERFCEGGFCLRCLKGIDKFTESKLLELLKRE